MMSNTGTTIAIVEKNMPMDRIAPLVEALDMDKKRFLSTVLLACERTPKLMDFPVQAHIQWSSSAAALGLEPDGVTGQAFPIPFGDKVQLIVGYKGFNTMAGRAGITINSGTLYEGDEWDHVLGPKPFMVKQRFGDRANANLLGAWAQAQLPNGHFSVPILLDMSEILAVKAKAPARNRRDSPWNDPKVGMPAMAQKTAVRRLQRILPSDIVSKGRSWAPHAVGAQMDMLHEEAGQATHVDLDGHLHAERGPIIEGDVIPPQKGELTPEISLPDGSTSGFGSFANYGKVTGKLKISDPKIVEAIHEANKDRLKAWIDSDNDAARTAATEIIGAIVARTGASHD